jgi:hypothetical protein
MQIIVKVALAASVAGTFAVDAWAQSQGPLTTVPWASRSRTVKAPSDQPTTEDSQIISAPPSTKPVEGAPEPPKPRTADK